MAGDDVASQEVLASMLRDAGWEYVSFDVSNQAWQFQGSDGARRQIEAETLSAAMRLLLMQLADRDDRDA